MEKQVWKFLLGGAHEICTVIMPCGAEILTAQLQGNDIVLWALVAPDAPKETRAFIVCYTGVSIPFASPRYIATFQSGILVFHVFEIEQM